MMSAPSAFILLWNSMQATPSPRSTSDAPEFFFTTPLDFLATVTDHTPGGACTGSQLSVPISQYFFPNADFGSSMYQDFCPEASNRSAFGGTGLPSFFNWATVASTPAASHNSKGPSSQLKPIFIARSMSTTESQISGTRFAEYVHNSLSAAHRNAAALSPFCGPLPFRPSSVRRRVPVSSMLFAMSRAANLGFWRG